ncbi:hypothetical protein LSTR_LSTR011819 [Laodelphax striatellus]|uniref:Phosphatidylinositol-specific phospholipase C X domain-containing protein n=1 Tax=Laodelphax striatellus TaxID=195883 RepID=A0A482XT42_LAOST|nr:hypothetical protein LSTR_LSTR011819 [Laodelphax striatellus]
MHWNPELYDTVALYTADPTVDTSKVNDTLELRPVLQLRSGSADFYTGYYETSWSIGTPKFPGGWEKNSTEEKMTGERCLPFWIVGLRGGTPVDIRCLLINPTWMDDHKIALERLNLTSLFIPGTHNSGCFRSRTNKPGSRRDSTSRYLLTQDQDIWNQLVYGIRYLDFRVGIYPIRRSNGSHDLDDDSNFWINHDLIKVRPLVPALKDVRKFLEASKGEIIILDFHRFPVGFSGRHHRHHSLVKILQRELGEFAFPYQNEFPLLEDIWSSGKNLIISYGDDVTIGEYDWLWPPIKQMWGNKQTPPELFDYLDECMEGAKFNSSHPGLWAAMAQLTPSPFDLLFKPDFSLRDLTHQVSRSLTEWCERLWWEKANIVATDFFLENNIINLAIAANVKKAGYEFTCAEIEGSGLNGEGVDLAESGFILES